MSENIKLAELKGYLTAKVDEYDRIRECNPAAHVSAKKVADDFNKLLEIVIDMQQQEEVEFVLNENSISRDKELEQCCEIFAEVEQNLHKQIQDQKEEIKFYRQKIQQMGEELNKRSLDKYVGCKHE